MKKKNKITSFLQRHSIESYIICLIGVVAIVLGILGIIGIIEFRIKNTNNDTLFCMSIITLGIFCFGLSCIFIRRDIIYQKTLNSQFYKLVKESYTDKEKIKLMFENKGYLFSLENFSKINKNYIIGLEKDNFQYMIIISLEKIIIETAINNDLIFKKEISIFNTTFDDVINTIEVFKNEVKLKNFEK